MAARGQRVGELIAVAGAQNPPAVHPMAEQVEGAVFHAHDAIDPRQQPGVLKRFNRHGDGRARDFGLLGNLLQRREAKPAARIVETP